MCLVVLCGTLNYILYFMQCFEDITSVVLSLQTRRNKGCWHFLNVFFLCFWCLLTLHHALFVLENLHPINATFHTV